MEKPSTGNMIYRLAAEKDLADVYALYMDEEANRFLTYDPMSVDAFTPLYKELLDSGTLYVMEMDNQVLGTYRLIRKPARQSHILYLGGFTIKHTEKGKGLGRQALAHIIEEAKAANIKRIELTVDLQNHAAVNLYKKMGFETEGIIRKNYFLAAEGRYYDEYLMSLIID